MNLSQKHFIGLQCRGAVARVAAQPMATQSRVLDGRYRGIALQRHRSHLRQSHHEPVPPTNMGSVRRQEMQKHELDCYSDCGYPTRPRPKVVLAVARPGSSWSAHHASQLQTVPVRVCQQQRNGTVRQRQQRASISTPFQAVKEKTNTERNRRHQRRSLGADIESGISESEESCASAVGYDSKSSVSAVGCGRSKTKVSVTPLEPPALSRVRKERLGLSLSWPRTDTEEDEEETSSGRKTYINLSEMSSHGRRKFIGAESNKETGKHASHGSSPKSGGKKPRKPGRALTFSFGGSSDKVRRGLGFLQSKVTRKHSDEPAKSLLKLPETHLAAPSSPILQGKKKSQTLPAISRSTEFQRHNIVEERDSDSSGEEWGPDLSISRRDRLTGKHITPPAPLVLNPSRSLPSELTNGVGSRTESPNYSQSSAFSSRRESFESQSSSPMSRQGSPSVLTMPRQSKRERRKLSDPDLSDRDSNLSNGGEPVPRGTTLKKRYTFCVRPTKQSPRPGWVSKQVG